MRLLPLLRFVATSLALLVAATACQSSDSANGTTTTSTIEITVDGFDDHTVDRFQSIAEVEAFGVADASRTAVKFAIPDLGSPGVIWLDGAFYELHDEWYWFRLLNGHAVQGLDTEPIPVDSFPKFSTIDEVYAWVPVQMPSPGNIAR